LEPHVFDLRFNAVGFFSALRYSFLAAAMRNARAPDAAENLKKKSG
jgi:hypothetical protein